MKLLLDTHTLLWFVLNDLQSSSNALVAISEPTNDIFVSPANYWEIAIKVRLKKLDLRGSYDDFIQQAIIGNRFGILPIQPKHTSILTTLPFHHRDPFDRLLVA